MAIEERLRSRLTNLIDDANVLKNWRDEQKIPPDRQRHECAALLVSVANLVRLICPDQSNPYRAVIDRMAGAGPHALVHKTVGEAAAILTLLEVDIEHGLIASVVNQSKAEVFDDFLDHADYYLNSNRTKQAGVIAGVVFEDTMRRICDKIAPELKSQPMEEVINALTKSGALTEIKAKRAKAAANVRTKATHADWDAFDTRDVKACIDFTREMIASELSA